MSLEWLNQKGSTERCVYRSSANDYLRCFQALGTTLTEWTYKVSKNKKRGKVSHFEFSKGSQNNDIQSSQIISMCLEIETYMPLTKGDNNKK